MSRRRSVGIASRARVAALGIFSVALTPRAAGAVLVPIHVRALDMSVDRANLGVGEAFHLTIRADTSEALPELDNLTLPNLAGFEELGDERRCASSATGTSCRETLTLVPLDAGTQTIEAAELDAIDARTGRPSRFLTQRVTIHVDPAAASPGDVFASFLSVALRAGEVAGVLVVAALALLWGYRQLRAPVPAEPGAVALPALASPDDPLAALVAALAREPTRSRAAAVRDALRRRASARDDETLADLLARGAAGSVEGAAALAAIERAAFCREADVAPAVAEALPYLR